MAGTLVANTINTDTGLFSTQNAYQGIAKAWIQLSGSATSPTINGSFNISSITRNSTGDYTFTFTTAMPNASYSVVAGSQINIGNTNYTYPIVFGQASAPYYQAPTASAFKVSFNGTTATFYDPQFACVAVFSS